MQVTVGRAKKKIEIAKSPQFWTGLVKIDFLENSNLIFFSTLTFINSHMSASAVDSPYDAVAMLNPRQRRELRANIESFFLLKRGQGPTEDECNDPEVRQQVAAHMLQQHEAARSTYVSDGCYSTKRLTPVRITVSKKSAPLPHLPVSRKRTAAPSTRAVKTQALATVPYDDDDDCRDEVVDSSDDDRGDDHDNDDDDDDDSSEASSASDTVVRRRRHVYSRAEARARAIKRRQEFDDNVDACVEEAIAFGIAFEFHRAGHSRLVKIEANYFCLVGINSKS